MCRTLLSWAAITNNLRVTAKGSVEQYSCFLLSEKGSSAIKEGSITFIFFFKKGEDNLVKQQLYIYSDPTKNTECRGTICNFWTEEFVKLARVCFTHRLDKWLNESFLIFFFFLFWGAAQQLRILFTLSWDFSWEVFKFAKIQGTAALWSDHECSWSPPFPGLNFVPYCCF